MNSHEQEKLTTQGRDELKDNTLLLTNMQGSLSPEMPSESVAELLTAGIITENKTLIQ